MRGKASDFRDGPNDRSAKTSDSATSLEDVPRNSRTPRGIHFTEAAGKVIAFINMINEPPDWQELEVHFTDGTFFSFEFMPQLQIKAEFLKFKNGKLQTLRDYGILRTLPDEEEEAAWKKGRP